METRETAILSFRTPRNLRNTQQHELDRKFSRFENLRCRRRIGPHAQVRVQGIQSLARRGRETYPLNPITKEIEGHKAYPKIADLPVVPESLSIITPSEVTRQVVTDAIAAGVKHIWMQPGAEDEQASALAREGGINVIDDGSCILVLLAHR